MNVVYEIVACKRPRSNRISFGKSLTSIKEAFGHIGNKVRDKPAFIPLAFGLSSVIGALISGLKESTSNFSCWLGTIGTICMFVGAHLSSRSNS